MMWRRYLGFLMMMLTATGTHNRIPLSYRIVKTLPACRCNLGFISVQKSSDISAMKHLHMRVDMKMKRRVC